VVDPQAVNYGWNRFQFEGPGGIPIETKFYGPIYNVNDSQKREPPYKVVSIGLIDGSMFDSKYKGREVYLMGIAINNPNSTSDPRKMTTGILHIEITKLNLPWFLENINNGVKGILFMGKVRISENSDWEDEPFNNFQGGGDYKSGLLQKLVDEGKGAIITPEMEGIIFFGSIN